MYKIRIDQNRLHSLTENYLKKYRDSLRDEIKAFLRGDADCVFEKQVGSKNLKRFTIKVQAGSFTYDFLSDCADPSNSLLDDLLTGDINKQISIIQRVNGNNPNNLKKLTAGKANRMGYKNGAEVDDFNAILYEIFITRSFEGKNNPRFALPLEKNEFVNDLNVRVCPYCGRAYTYRVEKSGKEGIVTVKPQLDHFLPKKIYPFLGMNFFNLIPCCSVCNMAPLKVDNDPLDSSKSKVSFLMSPHQFDESNIRFIYRQTSPDTYNPDSYDILVGYKEKKHKEGYNGFLAIDKFYSKHNIELNNMFLRSRAFHAATNGLYKGIGISDTLLPVLAAAILGFNLSVKEESKQLLYKFKKDMFLQMVGGISTSANHYYVDSNEKEIIVTI